jgi:hypothetical protein
MPGLATVGSLTLRNVGMSDLSSLHLRSLDDLTVASCASMRTLRGLEGITTLQSFAVTDSGVSSLAELARLSSVTGDFTFTSNPLRGKVVTTFVERLVIDGAISIDE